METKQNKTKRKHQKREQNIIGTQTNLRMRHLQGLNAEQRKAVTAPLDGQLQVVAGPGTGTLSPISVKCS
jgi:hypothetical protein